MYITRNRISMDQFLKPGVDAVSGASVIFMGVVRNHHQGKSVQRLFYECYEPMAEKEMQRIVDRAAGRYPVNEIRMIHRTGWLEPGEIAVAVEVRSDHRDEAFRACREIIDEIKRTVPIWKKELYKDGSEEWTGCGHAGTGNHETGSH